MKKTSEEWQKLCKIEVLDPDGWDRQNYQYSWHEELITRGEFERRLAPSTVKFNVDDITNIWKDINPPLPHTRQGPKPTRRG